MPCDEVKKRSCLQANQEGSSRLKDLQMQKSCKNNQIEQHQVISLVFLFCCNLLGSVTCCQVRWQAGSATDICGVPLQSLPHPNSLADENWSKVAICSEEGKKENNPSCVNTRAGYVCVLLLYSLINSNNYFMAC